VAVTDLFIQPSIVTWTLSLGSSSKRDGVILNTAAELLAVRFYGEHKP